MHWEQLFTAIGAEKMAKKTKKPLQITEGEEVKNKIKKILDDYFDNAHYRDPYDPFAAILYGRDDLLEKLFDVIKD